MRPALLKAEIDSGSVTISGDGCICCKLCKGWTRPQPTLYLRWVAVADHIIYVEWIFGAYLVRYGLRKCVVSAA